MNTSNITLTTANSREAAEDFIVGLPPYPRNYEGRGIVISGGGRYFVSAWISINLLRKLGCRLPIQLWHLGKEELDERMRALVQPLGVECVDGLEVRKCHPARILSGWELKPYAILNSPFREVLLLDADNLAIVNPEFLFDTPQYRETGAIFWPDDGRLPPWHGIWDLCGVPYQDEPEFESGQILVDKQRCWQALCLSMWYNEHSDFFYQHIYGDKDTFHLAFRKVGKSYSMPTLRRCNVPIFLQYDFDGHLLFQHRNKWALLDDEPRDDLKHAAKCYRYLEDLRRVWDGRIGATERHERPAPATSDLPSRERSPIYPTSQGALAAKKEPYTTDSIGLAIMTVDREGQYIHRTIESLGADLPVDLVVGCPSAAYLDRYRRNPSMRILEAPLGEWRDAMGKALQHDRPIHHMACWNYWRCLTAPQDNGRGLVIVEDDVLFAQGWRERLVDTLSLLEERCGQSFALALYAPQVLAQPWREANDLFVEYPADIFFGTQGFYFPSEIRKGFAAYLTRHGVDRYYAAHDGVLRDYLTEHDVPLFAAVPSLVQHIGRKSTGLGLFHRSGDFVDEVDAVPELEHTCPASAGLEHACPDCPRRESRVWYLNQLPLLSATVGYGKLGLHGDLGYEQKTVEVASRPCVHALSAHAPSRLVFALNGKYGRFNCQIALNDDVLAKDARAHFAVYANGSEVAQGDVRAGEPPLDLSCSIAGAQRLTLVVETDEFMHCHAVWLNPWVSTSGGEASKRVVEDCLHRGRIRLLKAPIQAERCVATVVSPGYAGYLDGMLGTLETYGNCPDAVRVVFAVNADTACREVIERYGATMVECTSQAPLNSTVKSLLYSIAHVVDAQQFLCLDTDLFVLGDLQPLFDALTFGGRGNLLVCRDPNISGRAANLGESVTAFYEGSPEDRLRLSGEAASAIWAYPFLVNDGVFAGTASALSALDQTLRALPPYAVTWLDAVPGGMARNQMLFNLALARLQCGVEMDPRFNFQGPAEALELQVTGSTVRTLYQGRPVRVKHFPGYTRGEYDPFRARLIGATQ